MNKKTNTPQKSEAKKNSADNNAGNVSVIECRALWKTFGVDADKKTKEAINNNGGDTKKVAAVLSQQGCVPAICNVSFNVRQAEIFVIMGLSGSGKSTLVRCLARLTESSNGEVLINGEKIFEATNQRLIELRRTTLGMVFQHFGLFGHMTALNNVAFPLKVQGQKTKERYQTATKMLNLVGLDDKKDSYPRELSGGQCQRVGIARSLAANPDIWFLDEPFSALDPLIRRQLQDEFLGLQKRLKKTIVFITHDIVEALKLADRIAIMRDGEIIQIGTPPEIVLNPVDSYVREFSRDVAKGHHACVESVMKKITKSDATKKIKKDEVVLNPNMTLDEALVYCVDPKKSLPVTQDGKVIGEVSPVDLVTALQDKKQDKKND